MMNMSGQWGLIEDASIGVQRKPTDNITVEEEKIDNDDTETV